MFISNPVPANDVWTYVSRTLTNPSGVWLDASRTLTQTDFSATTIASDVWGNSARTLTTTQFPFWSGKTENISHSLSMATSTGSYTAYTNNGSGSALVLAELVVHDSNTASWYDLEASDSVPNILGLQPAVLFTSLSRAVVNAWFVVPVGGSLIVNWDNASGATTSGHVSLVALEL